jgi:tetratricopeptide (TPR) repeat protein
MNLTDQQIAVFNDKYQKACDKMEGIVILENYRPSGIGFFEKIRAKKAIKYFEEALEIEPNHYQSLFFLGKIYQRFGEYDKSLSLFEKVMQLEKENHNSPLEASLVAMHLNQLDKALEYSNEGLRRKPNDFALLGNHSMNLLIAGKDQETKETIVKAITLNPTDEINKRIQSKIDSVIAGQDHRPTFKDSIG